MNKGKFLTIMLFWLSSVMLATGLVFAEHDCTHEVTRSDGTKTIITDCNASYTTNAALPIPEDVFNQYLYSTMENNLQDSIHQGLQNAKDRTANTGAGQANVDQITAESQEKQQEAIDAEQTKEQDQADNSKH